MRPHVFCASVNNRVKSDSKHVLEAAMHDDDKLSTPGAGIASGSQNSPVTSASTSLPDQSSASSPSSSSRNPGDDAPAGTVGTGEDVCGRCEGTGKLDGDRVCPDCDGSGVVIQGIGGG